MGKIYNHFTSGFQVQVTKSDPYLAQLLCLDVMDRQVSVPGGGGGLPLLHC